MTRTDWIVALVVFVAASGLPGLVVSSRRDVVALVCLWVGACYGFVRVLEQMTAGGHP